MANLETSSSEASGFKLFGAVIQPEASNKVEKKPLLPPAADDVEVDTEVRLPCPRCGSRETKFCYFNNYNVRQPRHLCRACRRYWTAGGALRRVSTSSGRSRRARPGVIQIRAPPPAAAAASVGNGNRESGRVGIEFVDS